MKRKIAIILAAAMLVLTACTTPTDEPIIEETTAKVTETTAAQERVIPEFTVTTSTVGDGNVLPMKCTAEVFGGENVCPQISWDSVDGANVYAVYMYDVSLRNWLHLCAKDLTDTSFEEGFFADGQYVGPYPPDDSGKHEYVITVYALKEAPEKYTGLLDSPVFPESIEKNLDNAGEGENIVAVGRVSVFFTANSSQDGE